MQAAFERGGEAHGNREGCLAAEARREQYRGGTDCPTGCGTVIAYRAGVDPAISVDAHASNPGACMKHPDHGKA